MEVIYTNFSKYVNYNNYDIYVGFASYSDVVDIQQIDNNVRQIFQAMICIENMTDKSIYITLNNVGDKVYISICCRKKIYKLGLNDIEAILNKLVYDTYTSLCYNNHKINVYGKIKLNNGDIANMIDNIMMHEDRIMLKFGYGITLK